MENQNQQYGASEIKKVYTKNLRRGLEYAIIFHVIIISTFLIVNYFNNVKADIPTVWRQPLDFTNIPLPPPIGDDRDQLPPPKPPDNISQPPKQLDAMTPMPVSQERADIQTIMTQNKLDSMTNNVSSFGDSGKYVYNGNDIGKRPDDKIPDKVIKKPDKEIKDIFTPVDIDEQPDCLNLDQVKALMRYPSFAKDANIEGKVNVRILVGADGKVIKVGSINGPEVFYDEVKDKVMNLEFKPGLLASKPVKVWVWVPFTFKLQ